MANLAAFDNIGEFERVKLLPEFQELESAMKSYFYGNLGLRGLSNCPNYFNAVLQVILNSPPLKNYFMAYCHETDRCPKCLNYERVCILGELRRISAAMVGGTDPPFDPPFDPAIFLDSFLQHDPKFSVDVEHDAEEFYTSLLKGVHANDVELEEGGHLEIPRPGGHCYCIVHTAFSGTLQSVVECSSCKDVATSNELFLLLSLSIPARSSNGQAAFSGLPNIWDCLNNYTTKPHSVCSKCPKCEAWACSKKVSIGNLPIVLTLNLRRNPRSPYVLFPFDLDINKYISSSLMVDGKGTRMKPVEGYLADGAARYAIYGVISREGSDYFTYLRKGKVWYKCHNEVILEVEEYTVRASKACMLFYIQHWLDRLGGTALGPVEAGPVEQSDLKQMREMQLSYEAYKRLKLQNDNCAFGCTVAVQSPLHPRKLSTPPATSECTIAGQSQSIAPTIPVPPPPP